MRTNPLGRSSYILQYWRWSQILLHLQQQRCSDARGLNHNKNITKCRSFKKWDLNLYGLCLVKCVPEENVHPKGGTAAAEDPYETCSSCRAHWNPSSKDERGRSRRLSDYYKRWHVGKGYNTPRSNLERSMWRSRDNWHSLQRPTLKCFLWADLKLHLPFHLRRKIPRSITWWKRVIAPVWSALKLDGKWSVFARTVNKGRRRIPRQCAFGVLIGQCARRPEVLSMETGSAVGLQVLAMIINFHWGRSAANEGRTNTI